MRMRKKKNLAARLDRCEARRVRNPEERRGRWRELWPGEAAAGGGTVPPDGPGDASRKLYLELGCGKGRFTAGTASAEPDALFVAVEVVPEAIVVAMERCMDLPNTLFISADVSRLPDFFAPGEVDGIYLNFSDPWPSNRNAKRRLTHGNFLKLYRQVLKPAGQIWFKTDNEPLFDFTLREFPRYGFALSDVTRNLHGQGVQGIMTDYEAKFHAMGQPIYRCVGTMEPWEEPFPEDPKAVQKRWLKTFAADVPRSALRERVLAEGNFLWHVFSWEYVPCLSGAAAENALREQAAAGAACWLFYWDSPPEGRPSVRFIGTPDRENLPPEPDSLYGADWYLIEQRFAWTYVHTHEAGLGPYFRMAPKTE